MKIAMMGSGGVGGFFGGKLAQAGFDVRFIARGAHLAAMREHGLVIENETQGEMRLAKVQATDSPATLGQVDLVILSVKLWDTESAAQLIKPLVGPNTGILSLQNGVIKDDTLRRIYGAQNIMGGVAYVGAYVSRPGVIHQIGTMQRIVLGEYDGRKSERAEFLHKALRHAGITSELSQDVRRSIWEKYVLLVGLSATTTSMRALLGPILGNARSRAFMLGLMREVVAVGRAHGVALTEDFADDRLAFADTLPGNMDSSMHHDLKNGNPLEVDWLSGGVVQLGREKNIPTPANSAVCGILALYAAGARKTQGQAQEAP
ncbi:MAG: 2-dehydropantoate 2-reductase [Candidimonas sp.]|nr:MAG: 2-dehydropantoate 2-reductase [Candidimonas sp.]TAM22290.1 MAG: 2-dehydropantoate 2-reductase [Candidimonas sp.]TAM80178.1 MAG: 2-dehydropantoate 2-reductase [Candidimonas sp.]